MESCMCLELYQKVVQSQWKEFFEIVIYVGDRKCTA